MRIDEAQDEIIDEFGMLPDWQDRYKLIIQYGKEMPPFPEQHRTEENKVRGCMSQVWMHADLIGDKVQLVADSDAAIVRGLTAIIVRVFSGHTPREIIEAPKDFIDKLGLAENLSQSRRNGLAAMLKQVVYYAVAYQALLDGQTTSSSSAN